MLNVVIDLQGESDGDKGYDGKNVAEDTAQSIHPPQDEIVIKN